jgi:hypothetical protein
MRGIFSKLPADTLDAALAPVAERCSTLAWAVFIQSGLIRYSDDDDELYDRWVRRAAGEGDSANRMRWLERGFLPTLSERLVLDEWSFYLGFDPDRISADALGAHLSHELHPRPILFEAIARFDLLYILRVDEGWWEGYTSNGSILEQLREGWGGVYVESDRWIGDKVVYPGLDGAT